MLDAQTKRKRRVSLKVLIFIVYYFYVWSSSSAVQYQYQHYPIKCSQHHMAPRATMANKPVTATRAENKIPVSMNTSIKVGRSFILRDCLVYPLPTRGRHPPAVVDIGAAPLTVNGLFLVSTTPSSRKRRKRSATATTSKELLI